MKRFFWSGVFLLLAAGCGDDKATPKPVADSSESQPKQAEPQEKKTAEPIDPATTGTIRGVVRFEGTPPEREKISMAGYADCSARHQEKPLSEALLVKNGCLQNAFVQIRKGPGVDGRKFDPPKTSAALDQVGCIYTPHVVALQVGQEIQIKNSDPLLHNIDGVSKWGQGFNDAMSNKGDVKSKRFESAEILPVKCDIHPWMRSYIAVSKHPFFAVTGENGKFEIAGLPPGKYVIQAWQEMLGTQDQEITLGPKETKEISFSFKK